MIFIRILKSYNSIINHKDCAEKAREEGGILRKSRCLEIGCCWDATFSDTPWCYYSAGPIETVPIEAVPINPAPVAPESIPFEGTNDVTPLSPPIAPENFENSVEASDNAQNERSAELELILEEIDAEAEARFGLFSNMVRKPGQNTGSQTIDTGKSPKISLIPEQQMGHPTVGPMQNFLPAFARTPKKQQSVLAENINDACKSDRLVAFMTEMGMSNPEKYGKIPCIADGKGALGTNRPAWSWSDKHKDTENNFQAFLAKNPEKAEKEQNKPSKVSYALFSFFSLYYKLYS